MRRSIMGAVCSFVLGACQSDTFFCDTPSDCSSEGVVGVCEATGYCSFPDDDCETGRRYGELAPTGLAGTCVPVTSDTEGSGAPTTNATTDTTTSTNSSSSTSGETTSGADDGSTTAPMGDGSSTSGEPGMCCDASCSTCGESCISETLYSVEDGESRSVAVSGDLVVWATGSSREVFTYDLVTDQPRLLAVLATPVTNFAVDDEHIFYLSGNDNRVGRIDLLNGEDLYLCQAFDEGGLSYSAGLGQIAVDDTNVYFAMGNDDGKGLGLGGAFFNPKEPDYSMPPTRIGTTTRPIGIGVDDAYIYVSDLEEASLYRYPKDAPDEEGFRLGSTFDPGPLLVLEDYVYAVSGSTLVRFDKETGDSTVVADTVTDIEGIAADEAHIYVTEYLGNSITRVSLSGDETPVQIAQTQRPRGIATTCNHIIWAENGTLSLVRQPK